MDNLFLARQPIYDNNKGVMGYELLYRDNEVNQATFEDAELASCETILNACMHIGIENIVGSSLAFINLPREFIVNEDLTPMFNEHVVLEVLEDIQPDEEVIAGLKRLKSEGYQIALDDFVYSEELTPLIELADYIKLQVNTMSADEIKRIFELLSQYPVKFIAEKVETHEIYQFCNDLGFEYFQGFFFCMPEVLSQKKLPSNKLVALNIIQQLQDPEITAAELEKILVQDITLSYKLLRYINSAAFALRREIESIKDAILLLGINNLKKWVSLIMMSKIIETKPDELIVVGMIRGRMCELLAEKYYPDIANQMFVIGLFSVLDALMDQPLIELLVSVNLSTTIKLALLDRQGKQGEIYSCVIKYERCSWDELNESGINAEEFIHTYLSAVHWADENMRALRHQSDF